jgi:hypothetical protein
MQTMTTGPVTLVYSWGSLVLTYTQRNPGELQTEPFQSTEAAVQRACEIIDDPNVFNMFITDDRAEPPRRVIMNPLQLRTECQTRKR